MPPPITRSHRSTSLLLSNEFGKPRLSPARACEFLGPSPPTLSNLYITILPSLIYT